jgi:aldehyde dehydrogenase (NAD+)
MHLIDRIVIGGASIEPHGSELFDFFNPATAEVIDHAPW